MPAAEDSAAAAVVPAPAPAQPEASNATAVDTVKSGVTKSQKKKPFNLKNVKKIGQIRLVKGFRPANLRPKISLDTQKDVADKLRKSLFERRTKYENFVNNVLGKASPVKQSSKKPTKKQPAPGAPLTPGAVAHDGEMHLISNFLKFSFSSLHFVRSHPSTN